MRKATLGAGLFAALIGGGGAANRINIIEGGEDNRKITPEPRTEENTYEIQSTETTT